MTLLTLALLIFGWGAPATWPQTDAANVARRWTEAFSAGEPAMHAFLAREVTAEGLAQRSMDDRLEIYRKNRRRFGTLKLASVTRSEPAELEVELKASDGSEHTFVFNVQPAPPHKLLTVKMVEKHSLFHHG